MEVTDISDKVWRNIVTTDEDYGFSFLAVKILLFRLRLSVKQNPDQENISKCAGELKDLFLRTSHLPMAQKDLATISQSGGGI